MRLYGIGVTVILHRTIEISDEEDYYAEDIESYLNDNYVNDKMMIEAIKDNDFEILDFFYNRVG